MPQLNLSKYCVYVLRSVCSHMFWCMQLTLEIVIIQDKFLSRSMTKMLTCPFYFTGIKPSLIFIVVATL